MQFLHEVSTWISVRLGGLLDWRSRESTSEPETPLAVTHEMEFVADADREMSFVADSEREWEFTV